MALAIRSALLKPAKLGLEGEEEDEEDSDEGEEDTGGRKGGKGTKRRAAAADTDDEDASDGSGADEEEEQKRAGRPRKGAAKRATPAKKKGKKPGASLGVLREAPRAYITRCMHALCTWRSRRQGRFERAATRVFVRVRVCSRGGGGERGRLVRGGIGARGGGGL